ncbi:hypothetical protein ACTQ50_05745 [Blautia sp. Sow4_E7]|uniref:hypothetical protein n=1 Tax=Blautia sp. Sow4_E7 TaxID=3438749 RepID=UPI003F9319F0
MVKLANEENLKPFGSGQLSESEEREMRSRGGKKSGETRRRKKTMKETAKMMLDMEIPAAGKELKAKLKAMGISEEDFTYQSAIMVGILNQAMKGNVKAAAFLRDTIGENPLLTQDEENSTLADVIEEAYRDRMEREKDAEQ